MASAVGGAPGVVRPVCSVNEDGGTAHWVLKVPGERPLWFEPLPEGKRRRFTKGEKDALLDYVLEVRKVKSLAQCAGECGIERSNFSVWLREKCAAHREVDSTELGSYGPGTIDLRELLADLWKGVAKRPIPLSDYLVSKTSPERLFSGHRTVPAQEVIRDGHLYFLPVQGAMQRRFNADQKKRAVEYWRVCEREGDSLNHCALSCGLRRHVLDTWVSRSCRSSSNGSGLPDSLKDRVLPESSSDSDRPLPDIPLGDLEWLLPDRFPSYPP
ncbi:MAG: hypothetical protein OXF02_03465 [Simkaniaceae bacterium]|nr:hypothetical protein [Simkaniaceae bacterium]